MNFDKLNCEIFNYINDLFNTNNPEYNVKYIETYYNSKYDLERHGRLLIYFLRLDIYNLDIIITDNYFIFDYKNIYIIINYSFDLYDNCIYKILTVKNRNEALRYRYSF